MNSSRHRIRSLSWQVTAESADEAFSWRRELHDNGSDLLLPLLEQAFDEADQGERLIRLDKLELKIRLASREDLPSALARELPHQLGELLRNRASAAGTAVQAPAAESGAAGRDSFDNLLHYLQSGSLPWQAEGGTAAEQAAELRRIGMENWPQLLQHLESEPAEAIFYFRLLQLLTEEGQARLVRALCRELPQESGTAVRHCLELLLVEENRHFSPCTRLNLLAGILAELAVRPGNSGSGSLLDMAAAAVPPQERYLMNRFVAGLPRPVSSLFQLPEPVPEAGTDKSATRSVPTGRKGVQTREVEKTAHPSGKPLSGRAAEPLPKPASTPASQLRQPPQAARGLFPLLLQQSGLVLLNPYIRTYFENCGLLEAGASQLPASALPRAAALLHFLASGSQELYEYELGLVKILIGLRPQSPLPVNAGLLTADDIQEAELLLQSAVAHWSALKKTSVSGFRAAFINRPGLLREEENCWKLKVERRAYDLLLEQIPWSFGMIKLPWMPKMVVTEW